MGNYCILMVYLTKHVINTYQKEHNRNDINRIEITVILLNVAKVQLSVQYTSQVSLKNLQLTDGKPHQLLFWQIRARIWCYYGNTVNGNTSLAAHQCWAPSELFPLRDKILGQIIQAALVQIKHSQKSSREESEGRKRNTHFQSVQYGIIEIQTQRRAN